MIKLKLLTAFALSAGVLSAAEPAEAIITTFTDRATFENTVGNFQIEDFNDVTSAVSYFSTPFDAGEFELSFSGNPGPFPSDEAAIEVTPQPVNESAWNVNGTHQASASVGPEITLPFIGTIASAGTVTFTFDTPIFAFGADFANISNAIRTTNLVLGNATFPIRDGISSSGFFGITSHTPFTEISIQNDSFFADGFGFDNVTSQPIPFEAETSVALALLGGYMGVKKFRQRQANG